MLIKLGTILFSKKHYLVGVIMSNYPKKELNFIKSQTKLNLSYNI